MEVLLFKYLKAGITYDGIQRVESYPMPEPALREALLNAVVHRDYAVPAPIQIRVHDDRLRIYNPGSLPEGWTLEKLLGQHPSQPYNPDIANSFFWAGEIETWGRGIDWVLRVCRRAGTPEPEIQFNWSRAACGSSSGSRMTTREAWVWRKSAAKVRTRPPGDQVGILRKALSDRPMTELMTVVGRKNRTKFRNQVLRPLLEAGWIR